MEAIGLCGVSFMWTPAQDFSRTELRVTAGLGSLGREGFTKVALVALVGVQEELGLAQLCWMPPFGFTEPLCPPPLLPLGGRRLATRALPMRQVGGCLWVWGGGAGEELREQAASLTTPLHGDSGDKLLIPRLSP